MCTKQQLLFLLSTETIYTQFNCIFVDDFLEKVRKIFFVFYLFLHNLKFLQRFSSFLFKKSFFLTIMCMDRMDNKSICWLFFSLLVLRKIIESMVDYVNICHDFYCSLISSISTVSFLKIFVDCLDMCGNKKKCKQMSLLYSKQEAHFVFF